MWSDVYEEHRRYLTDERRIRAFSEAVQREIRPGMVVVDVASGSGVLAILAARAGARVYAIEATATFGLTRQIVAANGLGDRITCIRGRSFDIDLPEPADVVIADQLDGFIIDAGLLDTYADACRRFLGPGGRTIPSTVDWWVAPIEALGLREALGAWTTSPGGICADPAVALVANARRVQPVTAAQVVGTPVGPITVDLAEPVATQLGAHAETTVAPGATVDGLVGWFEAELAPGVRMTNDPRAPDRIDRPCTVFPLDAHEGRGPVRRSSLVRIDVRTASQIITWQLDEGPVHGTPLEAPMTREDLARAGDNYVPRLSPRGRLEHRLLDLCDGRRDRSEIQRILEQDFPGLLPSPAAAAAAVAKALDTLAAWP